MSQKRRELNLRVIGAEADNKKVLYYLYVLDRLTRCDEVLGWLVARGFTGKNFASYIEAIEQAGGGVLEIAKTALKDINQLREKPPILVGKDIR